MGDINISRQTIIALALAIGISTVTVTGVLADYFFSDSELAKFYTMSAANVCREQCTWAGSIMIRLEIFPPGESRQAYLVRRTGECGSAGCESAVLLRDAGKMVRIEDRFGLDKDRAERIARRELGIMDPRESRFSKSSVALALSSVAVLCLLSAIITKQLASGLSIWKRIVLQSITAIISSLGLYVLGVVDRIDLLALPLIFGVTVTVVISVKDLLN